MSSSIESEDIVDYFTLEKSCKNAVADIEGQSSITEFQTPSAQGLDRKERSRVINSQACAERPNLPIKPPRRNAGQDEVRTFHAYMLLPGFANAFHAASLGCSSKSVMNYRARALSALKKDPSIQSLADDILRALSAEDGVAMALHRGKSQLPHWSRIAIFEYRKRGLCRRELATLFQCSYGTVVNVLQGKGRGYDSFSGQRLLTNSQRSPPAKINAKSPPVQS